MHSSNASDEYGDPDIERINALLADLKPAPTYGSMLDEICREIRRAALDLRSGETASALRRLAEVDETLSLQDDDQDPAALRSVFTRGPVRPLGSLRLPDGREIAVDEQTVLQLVDTWVAVWRTTTDRTQLRQLKQCFLQLLALMFPGQHGPLPFRTVRREPVDPAQMRAVFDQLRTHLPAEAAYRRIAARYGFAEETGWRRVRRLLSVRLPKPRIDRVR